MIKKSIPNPSSSKNNSAVTVGLAYRFLSFLIALFLITAGFLKVFSPSSVINTSRELFPWANDIIHVVIGSMLPVLELGLGIILILKWKHINALLNTNILFGLFFLISIYGQAVGVNSECGCFGGMITSSFGWGMMTRNGLLLLAALLLYNYEFKKRGINE